MRYIYGKYETCMHSDLSNFEDVNTPKSKETQTTKQF